jgi:hypothetical protein
MDSNDFSMKGRYRRQHINFWPVAIEADGAITSNFLRFFNSVCDAAKNLTDQNRTAFSHHCWSKRIACELHQQKARLCLQWSPARRFSPPPLETFTRHLGWHSAFFSATKSRPSYPAPFQIGLSTCAATASDQRSRGNALRARRVRQRRRNL